MQCRLHTYNREKRLVFAETGQFEDVVIFIGGLGDGLMAVPHIEPLAQRLQQHGWSLVQLLTSSSYDGWKIGSVERDAEEIGQCVGHLRLLGRKRIVLLGHSTGCQDVVQYHMHPRELVNGSILQAPVRCAAGAQTRSRAAIASPRLWIRIRQNSVVRSRRRGR